MDLNILTDLFANPALHNLKEMIAHAAPSPLPEAALSGPLHALLYVRSRIGDHGRLPPVRRLTQITDKVFLGGQVNLLGWRKLQSWGVGALVNMRVEWDDRRFGIHTPHYLWLPTIDGTPPAVEQLIQGVRFMRQQIAEGRGVYVHCAAGFGRAPSQVAAYLMASGFSLEEAIHFITVRRPIIHLSSRQRAQLKRFENVWAKQAALELQATTA
jgi:protein-tyrosine phosphatase